MNRPACAMCDFLEQPVLGFGRGAMRCCNAAVVRYFENDAPEVTRARQLDSPCGPEGKLFQPNTTDHPDS